MENLRCEEEFREASLSPLRQNIGYNPEMVCRAYKDPVILEDNRVFENMLDIEEAYMAASNYFQNTQSEIKPHMRKIVTDWMLEVCQDRNCHADVFLTSCNMMDRFLSQLCIKKSQFQLVAASTIFIASKLVDPCPVSSLDLIKYTDNTYDITEILVSLNTVSIHPSLSLLFFFSFFYPSLFSLHPSLPLFPFFILPSIPLFLFSSFLSSIPPSFSSFCYLSLPLANPD